MRDIDEMVSICHLLENDFSTININMSQISSQLTLNASITPISDLIGSKFTLIKRKLHKLLIG